MRTQSLLRCCCSITTSLIHLVIFASLFYPLSDGISTWQRIFPARIDPAMEGGYFAFIDVVFFALFLVGPLVLPPLASWIAFRFPTRMVSLVGLWISLSLTLTACLFFSSLFEVPLFLPFLNNSQLPDLSLASLVTHIPPYGFGLSFILCLALAIRLPFIPAHKQTTLRMSRPESLASMWEGSGERSHLSAEETRPARASKDFRLPTFASLGLLCHLLIALSLFFPYIDYFNPYGEALQPTLITGWQLLGEPFQPGAFPITTLMPPLSVQLATALLATLILPALTYLVCLLPWPARGELKDSLLGKSIYVSYLLNNIGLSLSSFFVALSILSHGGDLHDPIQSTHRAFAVPPIAFLLSLACSYVLVNHFRLRSGPGERGEEFQRETIPTHFSLDRKRLVFVLGALLGLITLMGTSWLVVNLSFSRFLGPNGGFLGPNSGRSVSIGWDLSRGEEFPFDVSVENVSDKTIILHPITFPFGFSASLQLRREVVKSINSINNPTHVTKVGTIPVEGYHLGPHTGVIMTLIFVVTAQGTYTIGPVTAHAEVPFTTVQVLNTYTQYALLCVEVDQAVCRQSLQDISG